MNENKPIPGNGAALITGGAKRVGRAITLALADAGYVVAVHMKTISPETQAFCDDINAKGGRAVPLAGDLSNHEHVRTLVPQAVAAVGALTLLVNNASIFQPDEVGKLDRDGFDRHMAVNLRAPVFLSEAFAAQAAKGANASIVNIVDQRVLKPTPLFFSYALSKNGLYAATHMLAQALAPKVRVNAIGPGPTLPSSRQSEEEFARQTATLPLGHGSRPEHIAEAVLFLARAVSITGQMLAVDGGQHIAWQTPDVVGIGE
jgi:NAD(P)-dependent dehydrogenase (short-subunit alcohol dehydrogenase family)